MKKTELIDAIAADTGMTKRDVERVVDSLGGVVADELADNGEVALPNIGKFKVKQRAARKGRNPQTGETINIPAKGAVTFKVEKSLAERVA